MVNTKLGFHCQFIDEKVKEQVHHHQYLCSIFTDLFFHFHSLIISFFYYYFHIHRLPLRNFPHGFPTFKAFVTKRQQQWSMNGIKNIQLNIMLPKWEKPRNVGPLITIDNERNSSQWDGLIFSATFVFQIRIEGQNTADLEDRRPYIQNN